VADEIVFGLDVSAQTRGEVVERRPVAEICARPQNAYPRELLAATPPPDVEPGWLEDSREVIETRTQGSAA
jgi:ABC-type dipeptide/oligopeptide/nickel transport system ATPase component